jgi:predicted MPP superfamily phosphohydrolase
MNQELTIMSRREVLKLLGFGGLVALGGKAVWNIYEFEVNPYRLSLPGLKRPLRVVQLSDFHYGPFIHAASLRAWVDATMAQAPDLIVITGDFVDSALTKGLGPLVKALQGLEAPLGIWGIWGNHDRARFKDIAVLERALAKAGVTILTNAGSLVRDDLYVAGVDDTSRMRRNVRRALRDYPAGAASLLLCHRPDYIPWVPATVGLTLCGHTHGGQIRLPYWGALYTSSHYGERFARGFVSDPVPAFTSRGLGVSMLPLRWRCPPEVVRFDLVPA